eukprot:29307-Pelagococcus_subviridis.AAC.3
MRYGDVEQPETGCTHVAVLLRKGMQNTGNKMADAHPRSFSPPRHGSSWQCHFDSGRPRASNSPGSNGGSHGTYFHVSSSRGGRSTSPSRASSESSAAASASSSEDESGLTPGIAVAAAPRECALAPFAPFAPRLFPPAPAPAPAPRSTRALLSAYAGIICSKIP